MYFFFFVLNKEICDALASCLENSMGKKKFNGKVNSSRKMSLMGHISYEGYFSKKNLYYFIFSSNLIVLATIIEAFIDALGLLPYTSGLI